MVVLDLNMHALTIWEGFQTQRWLTHPLYISDPNLVSFELSQINVAVHGTPHNIPIVMVILFIFIAYVV